jgi:hypothetical protein
VNANEIYREAIDPSNKTTSKLREEAFAKLKEEEANKKNWEDWGSSNTEFLQLLIDERKKKLELLEIASLMNKVTDQGLRTVLVECATLRAVIEIAKKGKYEYVS